MFVKKFALVWMKLKVGRLGLMYEACQWQKVPLVVEWQFPSCSVSVKLLAWRDAICLIADVLMFAVEIQAWVCTMVPPPIKLAPPFECSALCWTRQC